MSRETAIEYARSLLGVKWQHQGRTPWAVDCVGLIYLSLKAAGIDVDDETHYSREPWKDNLQAKLRGRFGDPIPDDEWEVGDIAVFKAPNRGPAHVALLADYQYGGFSLIHSRNCRVKKCVVEHALDAKWRRMLVEVYTPWAI